MNREGSSFSLTDIHSKSGGDYGSSLILFEASLTLSLVINASEARGAFPNAKLIRCSCSSSSVTGMFRDASSILFNSGSGSTVRENCCRSAIAVCLRGCESYAPSSPSIIPFFSTSGLRCWSQSHKRRKRTTIQPLLLYIIRDPRIQPSCQRLTLRRRPPNSGGGHALMNTLQQVQ